MRVFGLTGASLKHSFSSAYFTEKFKSENIADTVYRNFELRNVNEIKELVLRNPDLIGLNVTMPFKKEVIKLMDELDPSAEAGAVNTIKVIRNRDQVTLRGYNTDVAGFSETIRPYIRSKEVKALILGNGGAAAAVKHVFTSMGISHSCVVRKSLKGCLTYNNINASVMADHLIIVNCTPVGMHPYVNDAPQLPYYLFTRDHLAYDLIYNPEVTLFLSKAQQHGARIKNGREMLKAQAEASWKVWNA